MYCEECDENWCSDCDPPEMNHVEHIHCAHCSTSWYVEGVCCTSCWDYLRAERNSGCGPEYKACCPDCLVDAMQEFIFSWIDNQRESV